MAVHFGTVYMIPHTHTPTPEPVRNRFGIPW